MNNERYLDFLKFALYRIIETATLYENQAKKCKNSKNKLFLYFLAGKKRVQHVVLEMIAINKKSKSVSLIDYEKIRSSHSNNKVCLSELSSDQILSYAHERAQKDLNLYLSLATLEEDLNTKKLLISLSKLTKDFIQDITAGYPKFSADCKNQTSPDIKIRNRIQVGVAG